MGALLINPARVANFLCHRDLLIIQEMPNELIQTAPEAANKICRPLIKSGQLNPSNLCLNIIEFECFENKQARQRFSGVQTFDGLRDWRSWDYPWIPRPAAGVMTASLRSGLTSFRSSATKVVLLNVRSIPIRSGKPLYHRLSNRDMLTRTTHRTRETLEIIDRPGRQQCHFGISYLAETLVIIY